MCAVILVLAMILCRLPAATVKAAAAEGEAQYLGTEEVQPAGAEEAQSLTEGEMAEAAGEESVLEDEETEAGNTDADDRSGEMPEEAPAIEPSESAQAEEADGSAPAGGTGETAQAGGTGETAQAGGTGDAEQAAETGETAQVGETGEVTLTDEPDDGAQIGEAVEAEQTENTAENAKAGEEDEPDDDAIAVPANLRWEGRTGKWDAVEGAKKYRVELFRIGEDGQAGSMGTATPAGCEYTFGRIDLSVKGTYFFTVKAVIGENESAAARSEEVKLGPVPAPGNPHWDGKIARWDAVEGQTSYYLWLMMQTGNGENDYTQVYGGTVTGGACELDLTEQVEAAGDGKFRFGVRACAEGDNWYNNASYYETAESPVASFGNPDLIMLPRPVARDLEFSISDTGNLVATWKAPTGLSSDVGYRYRVTLYRDDIPVKTVQCDRGILRYDFTASGDAPKDSEAEISFGVRYVPTEEENRYRAGLEQKMYSWNTVTPAKDLVRSLEGTKIGLLRAGSRISFWPAWTGAYGAARYIILKLSVTKADGTKKKAMWITHYPDQLKSSSGIGYNYTVNDPFEEGDTLHWEAFLTNSTYYNASTETISGTAFATCTGTVLIEEARPHTVILNANGMGKDSSLTVKDNDFLSNMEGYEEALPVAQGYYAAGFSTVQKGLGEYTMGDVFHSTVTEDMMLYTIWAPAIDTVRINVKAPICGTKVGGADENGAPEVTMPMDEGYQSESRSYSWYTKEADGSTPGFSGTIEGGRMYYFSAWLYDSGFEGIFSKDLELTGSFTTGTIKNLYYNDALFMPDYANIEIGMMAEHDWSEWTTVKEAGETEDGLRRRVCKGCGEKEEEVIPSTGSAAIAVTTDGNGTASASADHAKAGDSVTLTATPKDGYRLYKWEVLRGGVKVSGNTFTMGKEDVEIRALFGKIPGKSGKVTVYNVAQGIKVTWLGVPDATSYYIYRDDLDGKGYKFLFRTSALEVTDLEVRYQLGKKFRYKVLATSKYGGDADGFRTSTYYRLMPTGITSVTNSGAGKMTVTYDKSEGGSGYVVRYGLKKDMSDAKVITVKGENTTTRTFSGLKKGQTYYVQARTYKIEDGIRYYSGYCLTKTVKIVK